jgi:hypothetical protein
MFGRLINGKLQLAPKHFRMDNGGLILNFNNSENKMKEFGFKEVIDIRPAFDKNTQFLNMVEYKETEESITLVYEVLEKPVEEEPVVEPTPEEVQISELKERINSLEVIINQLTQVVATIPFNVNNEEE